MGFFDKAKIGADIAKVASEIYGIVVERGRKAIDREARIKALEVGLAELKKRMGQ